MCGAGWWAMIQKIIATLAMPGMMIPAGKNSRKYGGKMARIIHIKESRKFKNRINNLEIICRALKDRTPENIKSEVSANAKIFYDTLNYSTGGDDNNRAG